MLKLTYAEMDLQLEYVEQCTDDWISLRLGLSRQAGQSLRVECCSASFLIPFDAKSLRYLKQVVQPADAHFMTLAIADSEWVEVSLRGTWVSSSASDIEGVFLADLSAGLEKGLADVWEIVQTHASAIPR